MLVNALSFTNETLLESITIIVYRLFFFHVQAYIQHKCKIIFY